MKNLILTVSMLLATVTVSAKDLTFKDMQQILPDMERVGREGEDYKCAVKTEWLPNGDLKVVATQQYKDWDPSEISIILKAEKNPEVTTDEYDVTATEYTMAQSTVLKEEDDYRVDLYESFSFDLDKSEIVGFRVVIAEVDHESDPREDSIYCDLK